MQHVAKPKRSLIAPFRALANMFATIHSHVSLDCIKHFLYTAATADTTNTWRQSPVAAVLARQLQSHAISFDPRAHCFMLMLTCSLAHDASNAVQANIKVLGSNGRNQMLKVWLPGLMQLVGDHGRVAVQKDSDIDELLDAETGLRNLPEDG